MGIDAVVVNASPLITLFRSAQADLVPSLFASVAEGIKKLRHVPGCGFPMIWLKPRKHLQS
jgi:hypothetical protein